MQPMLVLSFLLPLAACLPPSVLPSVLEANENPISASKEIPSNGRKWVELAQFDWADYVLSGVTLDCNRAVATDLYSCQYNFHWEDPNYNESTNCNSDFMWDGVTLEQGNRNTYSTEYMLCDTDEWWQYKFDTVRHLWDFNMTISKDHKDPKKFGDYTAQFFAYPNVTMELMGRVNFRSLSYSTTGNVMAKIQGLAM